MVLTGNYRSRTELRKSPRRHCHYSAELLIEGEPSPRSCTIADASRGGARLVLEEDGELPPRFILLLSKNGGARRKCRIVWRTGLTVGVEFTAG